MRITIRDLNRGLCLAIRRGA